VNEGASDSVRRARGSSSPPRAVVGGNIFCETVDTLRGKRMADSAPFPPPGRDEKGSRREATLLSALAAATVILVAVAVLVASDNLAGNNLGTGLAMPGFPGQSVQSTLFKGEAQAAEAVFYAPFNVSASTTSESHVEVGVAVALNVSCGGRSPYLIGVDFYCRMSLISNNGTPNEVLLWSTPFLGTIGRNVTLLTPGNYLFLVNVFAGTAPLASLIVPFSVAAEVAVLN